MSEHSELLLRRVRLDYLLGETEAVGAMVITRSLKQERVYWGGYFHICRPRTVTDDRVCKVFCVFPSPYMIYEEMGVKEVGLVD